MKTERTKCKHNPCSCEPVTGGEYCSAACAQAREEPEQTEAAGCRCGHEGCTGVSLSLIEAEGLTLANEALG